MNSPFLPFIYILPSDPAINWNSSLIQREEYIQTRDILKLRFNEGMKAFRFHIRRLSYSEIQQSKETTDPFEGKVKVLELCLLKVEDQVGMIYQSNFSETLRELLDLSDFLDICEICFSSQELSYEEINWLKISAWNNTKELDEAFQVPCGCSLIHKANEEVDPTAKELLMEEAPQFQKEWGCKAVCKNNEKPSEKAFETLIPLSNLTKINIESLKNQITTCPKYHLSQNWINEAIVYYNWNDKSQLGVLFPDSKQFKNTIKQSIDAISSGISTYQKYQNDQIDKKRNEIISQNETITV